MIIHPYNGSRATFSLKRPADLMKGESLNTIYRNSALHRMIYRGGKERGNPQTAHSHQTQANCSSACWNDLALTAPRPSYWMGLTGFIAHLI